MIILSLNTINTKIYFLIWRWEWKAIGLLTLGITKYFPDTSRYLSLVFFWISKNRIGGWACGKLTNPDSLPKLFVVRLFQTALGHRYHKDVWADRRPEQRAGEGSFSCLCLLSPSWPGVNYWEVPVGILPGTLRLLSVGFFTPYSPLSHLFLCFPNLLETNFVLWSTVLASLHCEKQFMYVTAFHWFYLISHIPILVLHSLSIQPLSCLPYITFIFPLKMFLLFHPFNFCLFPI